MDFSLLKLWPLYNDVDHYFDRIFIACFVVSRPKSRKIIEHICTQFKIQIEVCYINCV